MNSIAMGLVRFKDDMGYYPPILDPLRNLDDPYDPTETDENKLIPALNRWYSVTSLADYLIGYGNHEQDGWGMVNASTWQDESPRTGIRHPGSDGVWGATIASHQSGPAPASGQIIGRLGDRMKGGDGTRRGTSASPLSIDMGKTYGPYLELANNDLLAAINANGKVVFPNEAGYQDDLPKIIVDYWGQPIRYFRLPYPIGSIKQSWTTGMDVPQPSGGYNSIQAKPSLANVIALRPYNLVRGGASDVAAIYADRADRHGYTDRDSTTSQSLKSAEFALLSSGPDKAYGGLADTQDPFSYPEVRADKEGLNEDNLVELGP